MEWYTTGAATSVLEAAAGLLAAKQVRLLEAAAVQLQDSNRERSRIRQTFSIENPRAVDMLCIPLAAFDCLPWPCHVDECPAPWHDAASKHQSTTTMFCCAVCMHCSLCLVDVQEPPTAGAGSQAP